MSGNSVDRAQDQFLARVGDLGGPVLGRKPREVLPERLKLCLVQPRKLLPAQRGGEPPGDRLHEIVRVALTGSDAQVNVLSMEKGHANDA